MTFLRDLRADVERYRDRGGWATSLGFWVGAAYRTGARLHRVRSAPVRFPLLAVYKAAVLPIQLLRKVEIPARTPIGEGLCLPKPFGIVMPPDVRIGPRCTLHAGTTLGVGPVPGVPQLGADVTIHQGAKVLGGVRLGDGVVISANAVVTKDVPAGVVIQSPIPRVRRSDEGGVPGGSAATPPGEPEG